MPVVYEKRHRVGIVTLSRPEARNAWGEDFMVPHDALIDTTMEVARHLTSLPPLAARLTKESLNRGLDIPNLANASLVDLYRFMALELTEDKAEGHGAWREKGTPTFRGR